MTVKYLKLKSFKVFENRNKVIILNNEQSKTLK